MKKGYLDNIVWELTLRCNAHCVHCGSSAGKDRKDNLTALEIFRVCDELAKEGCRQVTLIGGEMFLHPLWREIIKKLHSSGIVPTIVTNAICLDDEKLEFLAENGMATIGISLDGATPKVHDSIRCVPGLYDKIFSLSDSFYKTKIPCVAITTVTKCNILELKKFRQLLPKTFFDAWQIQIGSPYGRMKEDISLSELEYYIVGIFMACSQRRVSPKKLQIYGMHDLGYYSKVIPDTVNIYQSNWEGCPAGKYVMGIRSNGKVVGCLSIYNDDFIEGDLRKNSVSEIWHNKTFCSWNDDKKRANGLSEPCRSCAHKNVCCAGCTGMLVAYEGDITHAPLCYCAIEKKYKNYKGKDEASLILRQLVRGHISEKGRFCLEDGSIISDEFIKKFSNTYYRKLLKLLK